MLDNKKKAILALPIIFMFCLSFISFNSSATGAAIISTAVNQTNSSTNTCVMTFGGGNNLPTNGNHFIVSSATTTGTTISSITDTAGDTFTKVVSIAPFNNLTVFIAEYTGTTGTTNTITITYSGTVLNRCSAIQVVGLKSTSPNHTSTGSGTGVSATLPNTVSSYTPITNNFVYSAYLDESTAGTVTAVSESWNAPFYIAGFGGIQGAAGTNYFFHAGYYPSWISGSTVSRTNVTMTGSTANRFIMVSADFFTGASSTVTSTITGTTTTAFSTTITNTVTSTSYSPTVTSTSFSPTVTSTTILTSYSPTVTSISNITNTLTSTRTVTSTSYSPTVTSTQNITNTMNTSFIIVKIFT